MTVTEISETVEERLKRLEHLEQSRQMLPTISPPWDGRRRQEKWNKVIDERVAAAEKYDDFAAKEHRKIEARKRKVEALQATRAKAVEETEARHRRELTEVRQHWDSQIAEMAERHAAEQRKEEARHGVAGS